MADEPTPTPTPTPTPAPAPTAWHSGMEAETIGFWQNKGVSLEDAKTAFGEVSKQYRALEKHMGVAPDRLIRLPEKPDDVAGWNAVHERLGMPKEAKDYDFAGIKHANGDEISQALSDAVRAALHNARVPKERAPDVLKSVVKSMDDATAARQAVHDAEVAKVKADLKKNWGNNFDYNLLMAMEGAKRLGLDKAAVDAFEGAMGYNKVMEALRKIGNGTREADWVEGSRGPNGTPVTAEGAQAQLAERMNDPAWGDRLSKGDAETVREWKALLATIHAGEAA